MQTAFQNSFQQHHKHCDCMWRSVHTCDCLIAGAKGNIRCELPSLSASNNHLRLLPPYLSCTRGDSKHYSGRGGYMYIVRYIHTYMFMYRSQLQATYIMYMKDYQSHVVQFFGVAILHISVDMREPRTHGGRTDSM